MTPNDVIFRFLHFIEKATYSVVSTRIIQLHDQIGNMKVFSLVISVATIHSTCSFQPFQPPNAVNFPGARTKLHRTQQTKLFAVVDIDENAPRDISTMDEWAMACGVQRAEGFQLTSQDGIDIYAMTTEDLPANSPVLYVPNEMILTSNKAVQEFGRLEEAEIFLESLNASDQLRQYYLMLKILVEYEKGDESPWFPWLNSLPRYFSNGASMTTFCYECLPPLVRSLAMKERKNLMSFDVQKVPFLRDETKNNDDLIKWAFQVVYTRCFEANDGSDDLRIIPMADMFNHGTNPEIELTYDEEGNCYAQTTRDVPAGSPLCMSYGDPTNPSFLFARYGFLDETSPATFCKIMIPHENSQLRDMGYAHNRMLFYKDTGDASEEVFDVLLFQILSSSNVSKKRKFYEAHMDGDYNTKQAFHQQYWPETSAKLLDHLDTFISQLDELSSKAYDKDIKEHPRLPLIMKHNEFVRNTFLAVRNRYFE